MNKERIKNNVIVRLLCIFFCMMLIYITQKPIFMAYNHNMYKDMGLLDYVQVIYNGLPLDMTTCGYVLVLPWLIYTLNFFLRINIKKILTPYFIVVSLLTAIIFVADTVLYSFWQFKLDTTVFLYTDKPADAMASVSTAFIVLSVLSVLSLTVLYSFVTYKAIDHEQHSERGKKLSSLVMLPIGVIIFLMIRGGVGDGTANVSKSYYSNVQFLNHSAVNPSFNLFYSMNHLQNFAEEYQYYSDDEERLRLIDGIFNTESVDSDTLLNQDRPNIILIVWEGCGASVAGCVGAEKGITPNLDKIADEGILFTNCHANSYRTDRGLVSINSGWLGFPSASLMKIPEKCEKLPGLAKTLAKEGYYTEFWYGGDISFTNMGGFMLQNGYKKTYSDKDFSGEKKITSWGVSDETLLNKAFNGITSLKQPFFSSILTLSSHEPWTVPYRRLKNDVENSFAYTDECIGTFVRKLKKSNLWNNTLLVIMPDHGVAAQEGRTVSSKDVIHIPIVMTGGAVKQPRKINTLMNQSDFAATLLGQLKISHKEFKFSRDVMSKTYTLPSAIHCSRVAFTFIDSTGMTTYDFEGDKPVYEEGENGDKRIERGKAIVQTLHKDAADM